MAFIMLKCSLYTNFSESFYYEWMLNFVKSFFCIYWDDHVIFILHFVNVVYHIDCFVDIDPSFFSPWLSTKLSEASFLDSEAAMKMFCGWTKGEILITDVLVPYSVMWILSDPIDSHTFYSVSSDGLNQSNTSHNEGDEDMPLWHIILN